MNTNFKKYKKYPTMDFSERTWPSKTIEKAPIWCSVDLRDGNQALPIPMSVQQKIQMFQLLQDMGYKEIEIGFPSASDTEYKFLRTLIEDNLIREDVTVQVLTQARKHLIEKTFEALKGAKRAIVHVYNSTSVQQRKVVFNKDKEEIIAIAIEGAQLLKELAQQYSGTEFVFEYSPESFTGTEMEYALEICEAVIDVWQPTPEKKVIINVPATVEMSTPNIYADQVEWFINNLKKRECILLSVHAHNDRGTSVAATELALLAGADRVEGTLFGNGERTGNVDILTLAMNLFSQGIDPGVNIEDIDHIVETYKICTGMDVHDRHPYAGDLVFTAFSGSHQDAIKKGLKVYQDEKPQYWEVPYLPIDPADIGRKYEAIIRINSQSGKGGVAFVLEEEYGFKLPKAMHPEVSKPIQALSDETGKELLPEKIFEIFKNEFLNISIPMELVRINSFVEEGDENGVTLSVEIRYNGVSKQINGIGNGPISAFFHGLQKEGFVGYKLVSYDEHAISDGENAEAAAYIQLEDEITRKRHFGAGTDRNTTKASIKALISAINRF
ncbi:MAG: 2-isopropylmalate synthase [Firmicutes bacterium HGW-Firmicutes-7]|nr:MAG: 2-isopropylmalate synthase [Firmicutes bacterium HGW-Firmicutes-7]